MDGKLAVRKDGGDVDALTAATISSRAYVDAINRAWMAYRSVASGEAPSDVASGASQTASAGDAAAVGEASAQAAPEGKEESGTVGTNESQIQEGGHNE